MAGWMLPLGVIRDHTDGARLGWRTGVYRVGVDGAIFLGRHTPEAIGDYVAGTNHAQSLHLSALEATFVIHYHAVGALLDRLVYSFLFILRLDLAGEISCERNVHFILGHFALP